jgi:hypothetical protein
MKSPRLKPWQWVVFVLFAFMLLGAVVPEQKSVEGAETTSPAVLLWILVVILPVYLIIRSRKKKKASFEAAKPSVEKFREEIREINEKIEFFANHESQYNEAEPGGVIAKKGEHVIAVVSEVGLIESRRGPTEFKGGSTGVSFRLTKRVSVRKSGMRGTATPGEETPTIIDEGKFIISDTRAIFVGNKQSREFEWDNLLSYDMQIVGKKNAILYLPVSNRQKVSGIASDLVSIEQVCQRVAFGVAVATGRKSEFVEMLRKELSAAEAELKSFEALSS